MRKASTSGTYAAGVSISSQVLDGLNGSFAPDIGRSKWWSLRPKAAVHSMRQRMAAAALVGESIELARESARRIATQVVPPRRNALARGAVTVSRSDPVPSRSARPGRMPSHHRFGDRFTQRPSQWFSSAASREVMRFRDRLSLPSVRSFIRRA